VVEPACCCVHPAATVDDLIACVPAPDFPTAGIIHGSTVREGYPPGAGRVLIRAKRTPRISTAARAPQSSWTSFRIR